MNTLLGDSVTHLRSLLPDDATFELVKSLIDAAVQKCLGANDPRASPLWENATTALLLCDAEGTVVDANSAFLKLLGYSRRDIVGHSFTRIFPPARREFADRYYRETYAGVIPTFTTLALVEDAAGRPRYLEFQADRKTAIDNREALLIAARDVTDRTLAEKTLRANEARFQHIAAISPVAIYVIVHPVAGNPYFEYLSLAVEAIYEIPVSEAMQDARRLLDRCHPDDRQRYAEAVAHSHRTLEPFRLEWRIVTPSGTLKWVSAHSRAERRESGGITAYGVLLDITDRKAAEASLRERQHFIEKLLHALPNEIYVYDLIERRNVYANGTIGKTLGYDPDELQRMGTDFLALVMHPEDQDRIREHLDRCASLEDGEILDIEYRFRHANGEWRWLHSRDTAFSRGANGGVCQILGTVWDATEQRRTESELREKQHFIERITRFTPNLLYLFDHELQRNAYANRSVEDLLGYTAEQIQALGPNLQAMICHPDDLPRVLQAVERCRALADHEFVEIEYRLRDAAGNWRWLHTRDTVFSRTPDGRVKETLGTSQDITDRKLAEESLRASEARFQRIAAASPGLIYVIVRRPDGSRYFEYVSSAFEDLFGILPTPPITEAGFLGDMIHPEDRETNIKAELRSLATLEPLTLVWRIRSRDGTFKWLKSNARPERRESGETAWYGVILDISEQKNAELAVRKSEELIAETQRLTKLGSWEYTVNSPEAHWSDELYRLHERDKAKGPLAYAELIEVVLPEDRAPLTAAIARAIREGGQYECEQRIRTEAGTVKWTRAIGKAVVADGETVKLVGTVADITEEKAAALEKEKLREQLQQAQKLEAIGTLTAGVAHEFNNVLAGILGNASLIRRQLTGDQKQIARLLIIEENSHRAAKLIRQLLDFSRRETSQMESVDLNLCISKVLDMIRPTLDRRIHLRRAVSGTVPKILGDEGQLEQVLLNLVVNARDAVMGVIDTVGAGRIEIALDMSVPPRSQAADEGATDEEPMVCLTVSDSGPGIPPSIQGKIFEPFFTTKEIGKGTGLGLSMVYGIVKNHHGHILVETGPEGGAIFQVFFPPLFSDVVARNVVNEPVVRFTRRARILVADDEPAIRSLIEEVLCEEGHEVVTAENGLEAVEIFERSSGAFDLVVLDANMPVLRGPEAFRRMRRVAPNVRVILASGHIDSEGRQKLFEDGLAGVITKPFVIGELLKQVNAVLSPGASENELPHRD